MMDTDEMTTVTAEDFGATFGDLMEYHDNNSKDYVEPGGEIGWGWPLMRLNYPGQAEDKDSLILIPVPATAWGDYVGSTYTRANFHALREDYPDTFVTIGRSTHDGQSLWLIVGQEVDSDLHRIITGLMDYPVYDEQRVAEVDDEVEREDVEYLLFDWRDDEHDDDDLLSMAYWNLRESGALNWWPETATNGVVSAGMVDTEQDEALMHINRREWVEVLVRWEYDRIKDLTPEQRRGGAVGL